MTAISPSLGKTSVFSGELPLAMARVHTLLSGQGDGYRVVHLSQDGLPTALCSSGHS